MTTLPLTGYRVLELAHLIAGPACGMYLADMGADVVKIEQPTGGDASRTAYGTQLGGESAVFLTVNRNKRSVALDLARPEGRAAFDRLAARADVVIEAYRGGVAERLGIDWPRLARLNPRLVYCSLSAFGPDGPWHDKPGVDMLVQAMGGLMAVMGEPDGPPVLCGAPVLDTIGAVMAGQGILTALLHRERTGEGQFIDAAILDTYFHMHEVNVPRVALRGDRFIPRRTGSQHPDGGPTGLFRCRDGSCINITALAHQWGQLAAAMGRPEVVDDPRFNDARSRRDNNAEIVALIEGWLAGFESREAALQALERHRVPCAPVLTLNEAVAHPHLRQRGTIRQVSDPQLGEFAIPGPPVRFSRWPERTDVHADLLGAHNEEILKELAGLSDAEIAALYDEGVLVRDPE